MVSQLVYCEIIFVFSHASSNVTHDCILKVWSEKNELTFANSLGKRDNYLLV